MKTITLSAIYDGENIRLEDDFPLQKNTRLLVTVLSPSEDTEEAFHAFRDDWFRFGARNLARAYDDDEPEYSMDMIKEPNPLYESR